MELTKRTLLILKNFSTINEGIVFKPGNRLKTITPLPTILATAELDTEIETEFCIADLPRFLSVVSLVEDPHLDITKERIIIKSGNVEMRYVCADPEMIAGQEHLKDDITFPPVDIKFTLTNDVLRNLLKASAVLKLTEIAVVGDGEKLFLKSIDTDNKVQDYYSLEIGDTKKKFKIVISIDNLKFIPADYMVSIGHEEKQGISRFKGIDIPVEYFVAVSAKSKYE